MATTLRSSAQISNAEFLLPAVGYSGQTQIELKSIPISILPNGQLIVESLIDAETLRRVSINAQVQFVYNDIRNLIQSEVVTDTLTANLRIVNLETHVSEIRVTVRYKVPDLTVDPSGAFHTDNITGKYYISFDHLMMLFSFD